MFEAFFNFLHTPFQRDIPPGALFKSPSLEALQGRLSHGVRNHGFLIVTGDSGCGKTTAIRQFMSSLDPARTAAFYISYSNLTPRNFYFEVLNQLGIKPHFYRGDAKRQLMREIQRLGDIDKKLPVIILDEAHLCNMEMLTEIRFLLNFNMDSESPMALILVGQSEIRDILKKQVYEAISQRIDLRCHIPPLDRSQTADYMDAHRPCREYPKGVFFRVGILLVFQPSEHFSGSSCKRQKRPHKKRHLPTIREVSFSHFAISGRVPRQQ